MLIGYEALAEQSAPRELVVLAIIRVLTPTFRNNSAEIGRSFATLGYRYPDRTMLGVVSGEAPNDVAVSDVQWPPFKERFAWLREPVQLIRALWRSERVTFEVVYHTTHDATIYDRLEHEVPVYIAAGGPVVAKYAGRVGDGSICTSGKDMEVYTAKLLPATHEGPQAAQRDATGIDRIIAIKLSYDRDPDRALENARFWAPLALTAKQKNGLDDPIVLETAADASAIASPWIVASDPAGAIEAIRPYVDAGLKNHLFHAPGHDQPRFLDQFCEDILPPLRR